MEVLFFTSFACIVVLGIRGVSIAGQIKEEIGYKSSALNLHYVIQSQVFSKCSHPLVLKTDESKLLYRKCQMNLRIMFLVVLVNVVAVFFFD